MTRVPVLTEAVLRAWGTDDPRVLPMLRAENQPGQHRRGKVIGARAAMAGWPPEASTVEEARAKQIRALRRLERMDWSYQGRRHAGLDGRTSHRGYGRSHDRVDDYLANDALATIFDE